MTTTMRMPSHIVESLASDRIDRIHEQRDKIRDKYINDEMKRPRLFGLLPKWDRERAVRYVEYDRWGVHKFLAWGTLADAERLWRTARLAQANGVSFIDVSSEDCDVLQPRKED